MSREPESAVTTQLVDEPTSIELRDVLTAGVAGVIAVFAMAPILAASVFVGVLDTGAFAGLATIVGLGASVPIGVFIFAAGGVTVLPLLFLTLGNYLPPMRSVPLRGVTFGTIVWSGFVVAFYTAQTGLLLGGYLAGTLLAHWVYGAVFGALCSRYSDVALCDI
ncbi:MAG: DUF6789 family protein [Halobacteriota archaeon]